ncbi:hypothetical protein V6N12_024157 [Hibiscus sabdariffa]|uniref:Uncharacterized protein n=1 Tax=Hibiscus sabdariffa TaxID=183260 RepID=A0ABR2FZQ8_9ROSI
MEESSVELARTYKVKQYDQRWKLKEKLVKDYEQQVGIKERGEFVVTEIAGHAPLGAATNVFSNNTSPKNLKGQNKVFYLEAVDTWYGKSFCRRCSQLIQGRIRRSFSKGIVNIRIPLPPLGAVYAEVMVSLLALVLMFGLQSCNGQSSAEVPRANIEFQRTENNLKVYYNKELAHCKTSPIINSFDLVKGLTFNQVRGRGSKQHIKVVPDSSKLK